MGQIESASASSAHAVQFDEHGNFQFGSFGEDAMFFLSFPVPLPDLVAAPDGASTDSPMLVLPARLGRAPTFARSVRRLPEASRVRRSGRLRAPVPPEREAPGFRANPLARTVPLVRGTFHKQTILKSCFFHVGFG